ncbi:MAG: RNA methyltransferase [Actinomycetia bacterium]|nr:RNA methyltransferase [Actinomycetes bacterium]
MAGFRPRFFVSQSPVTRAGGVGLPPAEGAAGTRRPAGGHLEGVEVALSPEDSYHARRVLRLREGDLCEVVVGAAVYAASVVKATGVVTIRLDARLEGPEAGADYHFQVGLVQALSRPAVMDQVFEKGTEVGASFFVLVRAAGSPRGPGPPGRERLARWQRIAQEAAKQSKQVTVPSVTFAGSLDDALRVPRESGVLSLVLEPAASHTLSEELQRQAPPARLALWVGPEGGWTAAESERFSGLGIQAVRLGRSVLRTETAGPVGVAVARLALGDW